MRRQEALYEADVRGLAEWEAQGKAELVAKKLVFWAEECWKTTVEEMRADVDAVKAAVYPSEVLQLRHLVDLKEKGRKEYYKYGWGKISIDEAIEKQKERIANY